MSAQRGWYWKRRGPRTSSFCCPARDKRLLPRDNVTPRHACSRAQSTQFDTGRLGVRPVHKLLRFSLYRILSPPRHARFILVSRPNSSNIDVRGTPDTRATLCPRLSAICVLLKYRRNHSSPSGIYANKRRRNAYTVVLPRERKAGKTRSISNERQRVKR